MIIDHWWSICSLAGRGPAGSEAGRQSRGPGDPHEGAGEAAEGGERLLFWKPGVLVGLLFWLLIGSQTSQSSWWGHVTADQRSDWVVISQGAAGSGSAAVVSPIRTLLTDRVRERTQQNQVWKLPFVLCPVSQESWGVTWPGQRSADLLSELQNQ